jgi:hypothetical protein
MGYRVRVGGYGSSGQGKSKLLLAAVDAASQRFLHPSKNLNLALSNRIEILFSRKE